MRGERRGGEGEEGMKREGGEGRYKFENDVCE